MPNKQLNVSVILHKSDLPRTKGSSNQINTHWVFQRYHIGRELSDIIMI